MMHSKSGLVSPSVGRITFLCQWDNISSASGCHLGPRLGQSSSVALCADIQMWLKTHSETVLGFLEGL